MSLRSTFGLNHDFPRLVQQLGFKFITNKPKIQIDWNLIGCVNIQELITNTEVYILEKHINDIIYYSLQEEEIRILDPKFVKLFRLTQLTLEYILFCLHYVDRGFVQLQNKLSEQEKKYEEICHELENKEKLLQKYKKKVTDSQNIYHYRVPDNLINGEIFQCEVCKKIFINEDYLNLHKAKRQHYSEQSPRTDHQQPSIGQEVKVNDNETNKLFLEIKQLKERINTTEQMLKNDKLNQNGRALTENEIKSTIIDQIDVQTSLESHVTPNYSDSCVQCDLLTEKVRNSENEIELLRREIREWQEIESNHILNQLETIKEKFNTDFSKLIEDSQKAKPTVVGNYEIAQHDNIASLEKKLDHKLESNVERLKNDLALQEQKWRTKLAKLEMKSDLITELHVRKSPRKLLTKQHSFSVTHNTPVTVMRHHDSSDSNSEDQSNRSNETQRKSSLPIIINDHMLNQNSNSQKTILKSQTVEIAKVDVNKNNSKNNCSNITHVTPKKKMLESTEVENDQVLETSYLIDETDTKQQTKNVTFQNDDTVNIIFTNVDHSNEISSVSQSEQLIKNHPYHNNEENSNQKTENISRQPSQSTLDKRSISSLKDAVLSNPNFLPEFRKTMLDLLDSSLEELGVNPEWTSIPRETLENHFRTLQHTQKYIAKIHPDYYEIRSNILDQVDKISSEQLFETSPYKKHSNKAKGDHVHKKRRTVPPAVCMDTLRPLDKITDTYLSSPSLIISPKHMKSNDDIKLNTHSKSDSTLQQTTRSLDRKLRSKNVPESSELDIIDENSSIVNRSFKRTKSSQALFSSVLKIKDKVMAAMKSSNLNNKSNKLQTNEKTEDKPNIPEQQSNKSEGLYKLTVFNKNNSPTSSKILSVTPVKRRDINIQKNTKSTSPAHLNAGISSPSISSNDDIKQKVNTIRIEPPNRTELNPSSRNSSISSASINEQQQIVVKPVEIVNINAMKYNETEEVKIANNPRTVIKKKVIFNLSKFNDKNSESKSSDSKIKSSTNEQRDSSIISLDRSSKRDELPENLLKSFMVSKKFEQSNNKTQPLQQLMYNIDGSGDSTSISSSVFDGSIKNTTAVTFNDNKQINDVKKDITKNSDDLLDISDFDFSSD